MSNTKEPSAITRFRDPIYFPTRGDADEVVRETDELRTQLAAEKQRSEEYRNERDECLDLATKMRQERDGARERLSQFAAWADTERPSGMGSGLYPEMPLLTPSARREMRRLASTTPAQAKAGRCESEAGGGPDPVRCVRDDGHDGPHRDAVDVEWDDEQEPAPKLCGVCLGAGFAWKRVHDGRLRPCLTPGEGCCKPCPDCHGTGRAKESTESEPVRSAASTRDPSQTNGAGIPLAGTQSLNCGRAQGPQGDTSGAAGSSPSFPPTEPVKLSVEILQGIRVDGEKLREAIERQADSMTRVAEIGPDYKAALEAKQQAEMVSVSREKLEALEAIAAWVHYERPPVGRANWDTVRLLLARLEAAESEASRG